MADEVLYRYEETVRYFSTGVAALTCYEFPIIKRTPKGAWIEPFDGGKKFVLLTAYKRFACETKAQALESFIARKNKQLTILTEKISITKVALAEAKGMQKP